MTSTATTGIATGPLALRFGRLRFTLLLAALLALLLLSPSLDGSGFGDYVLTGLFSAVMVAAVYAVGQRRTLLALAAAIAVPWLYLTWLHPVVADAATDIAENLLLIGLCVLVLGAILRRVLGLEQVDADALSGAVAAYLLLAVIWAVAFSMIDAAGTGAFTIADARPEARWNQLLYFSLVTLTTLGYGDISPVDPLARMFAALEAVTGTLYLAVLIARLVSLYRR